MQGEGATGQAVPEQHGGEDDGDQRLQDQHSAEGPVRRVLYCSALYCTVLYRCGVYDLEVATNPCTSAEVGVRVSLYLFQCLSAKQTYKSSCCMFVSQLFKNYSTIKLATN